jgi:hypothetical protein
MRALHRFACIALPLAATLACGSIDDPNKKKPLAVLEGQLTQASTAQSAAPAAATSVRIAVVWAAVDGRGYKSTQDIPAEAVFPSKFRLELTEPPPESAMISRGTSKQGDGPPPDPPQAGPSPAPAPAPPQGGGSGGVPGAKSTGVRPMDSTKGWPADFAVAVGSVVAYEDKNGNGKLDLVDDGATSYIDRILGANEKMLLVYTEGSHFPAELTAPNGTTPSLGYNLMNLGEPCAAGEATDRATTDQGGAAGRGSPPPPCDASNQGGWLPMTTLYELPLTADPRFGKIMCKSSSFFGEGGSGGGDAIYESDVYYPGKPVTPGPGPDGKYPAKNDPNVYCQDGGRVYSYTKCEEISQGLCKGTIVSCTSSLHGFPAGATTPPADWPCTVK